MNRARVAGEMEKLFVACLALRDAGQKEYAHDEDNAFRNFEALGHYLEIDRERILLVYLMKHMDGIVAHVRGHRSQREPVTGRIKDAIVYLGLLYCMEKEREIE